MLGSSTFDVLASHRRLQFFLLLLLAVILVAWATGGATRKQAPERKLTSAQIAEAEQRLNELGYWVGPIDGEFDSPTRHALVAFQKIEGRKRTGQLTAAELDALRSARAPEPRHHSAPHIEIDLRRQVLMFVGESGPATRVLPVSSGNGSTYFDRGARHKAHTPRGSFIVLRKIRGWRRSSLGLLYYPSYIVGGIAVHGSPSVPSNPASHGCIRIPMFAAKDVSDMMPVGALVEVYD